MRNTVIRSMVLVVAVLLSAASAGGGGGGGGGNAAQASGPMPAGATWEGNWQTTFGPVQIVDLRSAGKDFDYGGTYSYVLSGAQVNGLIAGKTNGNVFVFVWQEERANGTFSGMARWFMNPDGQSFTGTWGSGESVDNAGQWIGRR